MASPLNPHMIANAPKLYVRYLHPSDVFHMVEKMKHWKDNEYLEFISNTDDQLDLFKEAWGKRCPYWSIISVDHMGRIKYPCYMGSSNPDMIKLICERCGVGPHSIICSFGISDAVGAFVRGAGPKLNAKLPVVS